MGSANTTQRLPRLHPAVAILTSIGIVGMAVLTILIVTAFLQPV